MNKNELIKSLSKESSLSQKDCKRLLNSFANLVAQSLKNGDPINILGFGKFDVKLKRERKTYNPITKSNIIIPASKVPFFRAGKTLKEAIY